MTAGDFDGDGLEDPGLYLSITSISPAIIIKPFRNQEIRLISAPPSLLPRPLAGFTNDSRSAFFNIQTPLIRQFDVSIYDFSRIYTPGERKRFDGEIVPGSYQYSFPAIASDTIPAILSINHFQTLDGYRKINNQKVGFRFTNVTFDDGFAVLNPFQINTFKWEGNTPSFISPGLDRLFLSVKRLVDPSDPNSDPEQFDPIFPNFTGPEVSRVLLPSALNTEYVLAPNFLAPGSTGVLDLEFELLRRTNNVVFDDSIRRFRLPVRVTSPFFVPPPPEASESAYNDPDADYDGDGVSNFSEWVFGSDRGDSSSVPASPSLSFVTSGSSSSPASADGSTLQTLSETTTEGGAWEFKVAKVQNADPPLQYDIERSTDMINWTVVVDDSDWRVVDNMFEKKVVSRNPEVSGGSFFRAKVQVK